MSEQTEAERRNEIRAELFENAEKQMRRYRSYARDIQREVKGRGVSDPGNVTPFMAGLYVGLELGLHEVEDLDKELMYEPEDD